MEAFCQFSQQKPNLATAYSNFDGHGIFIQKRTRIGLILLNFWTVQIICSMTYTRPPSKQDIMLWARSWDNLFGVEKEEGPHCCWVLEDQVHIILLRLFTFASSAPSAGWIESTASHLGSQSLSSHTSALAFNWGSKWTAIHSYHGYLMPYLLHNVEDRRTKENKSRTNTSRMNIIGAVVASRREKFSSGFLVET